MRVVRIIRHLDHQDRLGGNGTPRFRGEMVAEMLGREMAESTEPKFCAGDSVRTVGARQLDHLPNDIANEGRLVHIQKPRLVFLAVCKARQLIEDRFRHFLDRRGHRR